MLKICNAQRIQQILLFCLIFLGVLYSSSQASNGIHARYQSTTGTTISFIVEVGNPAPTNLIIHHFHQPDNPLLKTTPAAQKINNQNGSVKWFLKNIHPGRMTFTLSFQKNVTDKNLRLIVRYRDPATGGFIEKEVRP